MENEAIASHGNVLCKGYNLIFCKKFSLFILLFISLFIFYCFHPGKDPLTLRRFAPHEAKEEAREDRKSPVQCKPQLLRSGEWVCVSQLEPSGKKVFFCQIQF